MSEFNELRDQLAAKLETLVRRSGGIETQLRDPGEQDWEENAIRRENDEALVAIGDATDEEIREIRTALKRIDDGSYGTCTQCHKSISKARLEALPWATSCIKCAAATH
ncbi:MAG: TraR/DksA family transcriptional regulator [Pirellula sp.]|jgi:DnaK suppressor protein